MPAVEIATLATLRPGVGHQLSVGGRYYALWLLDDGTVRLTDNACLHVGGPLVDGPVRDGCVICPWHGWVYDLTTGLRQTALGPLPGISAYRAWVEGDAVFADVPLA